MFPRVLLTLGIFYDYQLKVGEKGRVKVFLGGSAGVFDAASVAGFSVGVRPTEYHQASLRLAVGAERSLSS